MSRVTRGNVAAKRRKKYFQLAKGYRGANSRLSTLATEQVIQGFQFAYVGRKLKKRQFRRYWIYRVNSACRVKKNNYSQFLGKLRKKDVLLNRKILAALAFKEFPLFSAVERFSKR
jgi:large subunit ribosomal protein L20